tara:strand:- start:1600 stop:1785 length:186 start_codon:yes stop_codon:yes gene_type:complete
MLFGGNMQVGDLVKIKQSTNINIVGKWAIVLHKGTWSRDIYIFDFGYETRIAVEKLEPLCK